MYEIIPLDNIHVEVSDNYRSEIKEKGVRDLYKSFVAVHDRTNGRRWMLNAVEVVKLKTPIDGKEYKLRIGYRRIFAAKYTLDKGPRKYSWASQVPAIVHDESAEQKPAADLVLALIENIQREAVNPLDEAFACQEVLDTTEKTQTALGKMLGKSKGWVSQRLALQDLSESVQASLSSGDISFGHAREVGRLKDADAQDKFVSLVEEEEWDVRDTKYHVSRLLSDNPTPETRYIADETDLPKHPKPKEKKKKEDEDATTPPAAESDVSVRVREVTALVDKVAQMEKEVLRSEYLATNAKTSERKPVHEKRSAFYAGAQAGIAWAMGQLEDIDHEDLSEELEDGE